MTDPHDGTAARSPTTPISRRAVLGGLATAAATTSAPARISRTDGWDVVVVGAGVFGAWTLQRRGARVLPVDA